MSHARSLRNPGGGMSRREFLGMSATGLTTAAVGSTMLFGGKSAFAATDDRDRPFAVIRTAEYFGDEPMTLTFPPGWQVQMCRMVGHDAPALEDDEIRAALRNTIGQERVAALAEGKRNVVITFDDCARPTPTGRVVPFILEELHAGGVSDEYIFFHASDGTHSAMYQMDFTAKLGQDIVARYPVWNHDCFNGVRSVGKTSGGMEVKLSKRFLDADLKICISGIKPHGMAGYGGGAKAIVPGVAHIDTAAYAHEVLDPKAHTAVAYVNNLVRLNMEEAARLAKLDMSVNVVMNGDRQVAGVFAGDVVQAHRAAVKVAHGNYHTEIPKDMDVVISNAYPQSVEAGKELKYCRLALRDGGTAILIQDTPAGQRKIHYLGWREDSTRRGLAPSRKGLPVRQAGQVIIFNRWPSRWDAMEYSDDVYFASSWDQVLERLTRVHGEGTKVAVFPTASLQHEPMELRM